MTDDDNHWLLPEGIEEVLPPQAFRMERLRRRLIDGFDSWGYDLVMPPFVEYLDSLLMGTGQDLDLKTFKLIDQLSGRMMGVRADMTPQVARIDAHSLRREEPTRLCYLGTVLHAMPDGPSAHRSPIQVGAELYGHAGAASDAEIILLMLECLAWAGLEEVHLDIGHVGVFRGLARLCALPPERERELFDALQLKSSFEIERLLAESHLDADISAMVRSLVDLNGDESVLERASNVLEQAPSAVHECLQRLNSIAGIVKTRSARIRLHFDLAELRGYRYEQGVVFAAFLPGRGQEIARGGRYDGIGQTYGGARPGVGFSTDLKLLVGHGNFDDSPVRGAILAPSVIDEALSRKVEALRSQGERVIWELPEQAGTALSMGCDRMLVKRGREWSLGRLPGEG